MARTNRSVPKPSTKDLKNILKGVIAADDTRRLQACVKALQWYDIAIPYVISKNKGRLSSENLKEFSSANKFREKGVTSKHLEEKEAAYKLAIRKYEHICSNLGPPSINKYYELYMGTKTKLEADELRLQDKFGHVLLTLSSALPTNLRIKVGKIEKARYFSGKDTFFYSKTHAQEMRVKLKREGILALAVQEIPYITRALSMEDDGVGGGMVYSPKKHVDQMKDLLEKFLVWSKTEAAPKRLVKVRSHSGVESEKKPRKGNRGFAQKATAPKGTIEYFRKGSIVSNVAIKLSSGKEYQLKDILEKLGNVIPSVKRLARHGKKYGGWTIDLTEKTVKMTKEK